MALYGPVPQVERKGLGPLVVLVIVSTRLVGGLVVVVESGVHQGLVVVESFGVVEESSGTHQGLVVEEGEVVVVEVLSP